MCALSPSHIILTSGQAVLAQALYRQTPGRVAAAIPKCVSLQGLTRSKKSFRCGRLTTLAIEALRTDLTENFGTAEALQRDMPAHVGVSCLCI